MDQPLIHTCMRTPAHYPRTEWKDTKWQQVRPISLLSSVCLVLIILVNLAIFFSLPFLALFPSFWFSHPFLFLAFYFLSFFLFPNNTLLAFNFFRCFPFPFLLYWLLHNTFPPIPFSSASFHLIFFPYLSFVIISFHLLHLISTGFPSSSTSFFPSLPVAEKGKIVNGRLVSGADRYTTSIDEYPADAFRFYPSFECLLTPYTLTFLLTHSLQVTHDCHSLAL